MRQWTTKQDEALIAARNRGVPWQEMDGKKKFGGRSHHAIKKHYYRALFAMAVAAFCITAVNAQILDGMSADILTNGNTNMVQGRVEFPSESVWSVGLLGEYFTRIDTESTNDKWGVGGFAKLRVDPNASVPLANWFPAVGQWLNLPESLTGETYLIGLLEVLPYEDGVDLALSVGPGVRVGPLIAEYGYRFIESGDADIPALSSKAEFRVGVKPITSIWPLKFIR